MASATHTLKAAAAQHTCQEAVLDAYMNYQVSGVIVLVASITDT